MLSRTIRLLLAVGALCALAPAAAGAAVTLTDACVASVCSATITGVAGDDDIDVKTDPDDANHTLLVADGASATDPWTINLSSAGPACTDTLNGTTRTIECDRAWAGVTINADNGNDNLLTTHTGPVTFVGGAGDDTLQGGAGDDTLTGNSGNDDLDGGAGRDRLTPGVGSDDVIGGEGFDEVSYVERTAALNITLDDIANDGETGENDNVRATVEDVVGGRGDDRLTGSPAGNVLDGRAGNDVVNGGDGLDALTGGDGDDTIQGRDGQRENLDCGSGNDAVVGDQIDVPFDCESQDLSADLIADFDNDSFAKPGDCNDRDANIRPNATEIPDNGVDENCDGADAVNLDRDKDGSQRPADCDDTSPTVNPTAAEVLGNATDEDCSGLADPFPSITSTVLNGFTAFAGFTKVDRLKVRNVPAGATVKVTCTGGGCPKQGISRRLGKRTSSFDIRAPFRGARLRRGARIEVRITKTRTIGRLVRFTMRPATLPRSNSLCLPPGESKGEEC